MVLSPLDSGAAGGPSQAGARRPGQKGPRLRFEALAGDGEITALIPRLPDRGADPLIQPGRESYSRTKTVPLSHLLYQ